MKAQEDQEQKTLKRLCRISMENIKEEYKGGTETILNGTALFEEVTESCKDTKSYLKILQYLEDPFHFSVKKNVVEDIIKSLL